MEESLFLKKIQHQEKDVEPSIPKLSFILPFDTSNLNKEQTQEAATLT